MDVAAPIDGFLESFVCEDSPQVQRGYLMIKYMSQVEKKACTATKWVCNKVQEQFYGNTPINPACRNDHVYECNASTGKACDYGYRSSCAKCRSCVAELVRRQANHQ